MQRDLLLLTEMIDAAEQARSLVAGLSPSEVDADRMRRESLLCNFTVLGEASTLVSLHTTATEQLGDFVKLRRAAVVALEADR